MHETGAFKLRIMLSATTSTVPADTATAPAESAAAQTETHATPTSVAKPAETTNTGNPGRQLLKQLKSEFPIFRKNLPLSVGIDKQIIAKLPDIERKALRIALGMHTKSALYLHKMAEAKTRYNLDESPAEEIKDTHRGYAQDVLKERSRKDDERRKHEREAQEKAQRAAEEAAAEQRRLEKLNQLTAKFSRKK